MSALPTQQNISYDSWKNELNNLQIPSEISLLIAHSIGNEFMIRYCAERGLKAEVYIGLAGFVESFTHEGRDDLNNVIAKMQCSKQEITKFKTLVVKRYAIFSNDDHIVPYDILQKFPQQTDATPIMIPSIGHMGKKSGLEQLPEVIELVKSLDEEEN